MMGKYIIIFLISLNIRISYLQKYEPCVDRYTQCKSWKEQNMCTMSTYREYMIQTCPESCNICKGAAPPTTQENVPPPVFSERFDAQQPVYAVETSTPNTTTIIDEQKVNKPVESSGHEKTAQPVTMLPQAMRLIQSLTQMISQTSTKKLENGSDFYKRNKERNQEKSNKKHNLEGNSHRKGSYPIPMSRREKVDFADDVNDVDTNDNTLKMIIQTKKRSVVQAPKEQKSAKKKHNKPNVPAKKAKQSSASKKAKSKTQVEPQPEPVTVTVGPSKAVTVTKNPQNNTNLDGATIEQITTTASTTASPSNDEKAPAPEGEETGENFEATKKPSDDATSKKPTTQATPSGEKAGEQGGEQGGELGGEKGGEQGGKQGGELGGEKGGEQGGKQGGELGGEKGGEQGGEKGEEQGGEKGGELGGEKGEEQGGEKGEEQGGEKGEEQGGEKAGEKGGNKGGEKGEGTTCEDCHTRYCLILKQTFDPDYEDTASSKYTILKGNLTQDIEYVLGSDATVAEVEFEEVPGKSPPDSLTKAHFTLSGDLSNIDQLQDLVNKGSVNGLLVKPFSLKQE